MRVLVCGGRDFADQACVDLALNGIALLNGRLTIIQGGATGADAMARDWVRRHPSHILVTEPANWKRHGRAAGPIRNQKMLDRYVPDMVAAFPGGRGTEDMVARSLASGLQVSRFWRLNFTLHSELVTPEPSQTPPDLLDTGREG